MFEVECTCVFLHWGYEIILYLIALALSNYALLDENLTLHKQVSDIRCYYCVVHRSVLCRKGHWVLVNLEMSPPPKKKKKIEAVKVLNSLMELRARVFKDF